MADLVESLYWGGSLFFGIPTGFTAMIAKKSFILPEHLQKIIIPEQVVEVRVLGMAGRASVTKYFRGDDLESLCSYCEEIESREQKLSGGIYFGLNPLKPELLNSTSPARDSDVIGRRWILIDLDPVRPAGACSTDEQQNNAWKLTMQVLDFLKQEGFTHYLLGDSGNGWHILLSVNLINSEKVKGLVKAFLKILGDIFNSEGQVKIDPSTSNASRICRLYGTVNRKGEDKSTWRLSQLLPEQSSGTFCLQSWDICQKQLEDFVEKYERIQQLKSQGKQQNSQQAYGRASLQKEIEILRNTEKGGRNVQLNKSCFALGQLIAAGVLDRSTAYASLYAAAMDIGLPEDEIERTLNKSLAAGEKEPRKIDSGAAGTAGPKTSSKGTGSEKINLGPESDIPEIDPSTICTLFDLETAGSEITWIWHGWLQRGVVNVLGAEPGTGKTRFVADLFRRIAHQLPWPDGQEMNLPSNSQGLFVLADNNHDEMVQLGRDFDIKGSVLINTTKDNPWEGTSLDSTEDFQRMEAIIKAVKPAMVIIDTVGNATSKKLYASEDMMNFYKPLQEIARRNQVCLLCLTHLNSGGGMLGRRVLEKARSVLKLDKPDPDQENRRRLEVIKSNSKKPAALGVTMGDNGNEYDLEPPNNEPGTKEAPRRIQECLEWLDQTFGSNPGPVLQAKIIDEAKKAGFDKKLVYRTLESDSERFNPVWVNDRKFIAFQQGSTV
jgi:uncharacterized protein (UPF0335 family)